LGGRAQLHAAATIRGKAPSKIAIGEGSSYLGKKGNREAARTGEEKNSNGFTRKPRGRTASDYVGGGTKENASCQGGKKKRSASGAIEKHTEQLERVASALP